MLSIRGAGSTLAGILFGVLLFTSIYTSVSAQSSLTDLSKLSKNAGDKSLLFGGCDSDPYEALKPYIYNGNIVPKQSGQSLKDGIDPALACRLSKFLKHANTICSTRIISGHRSAAHQQSICGGGRTGCAAPGSSCHQYGLAVDLSSDCGGRLRPLAKQYSLTFPYSGIHVQCAEHPRAGRSSCTGPCNGGIEIGSDAKGAAAPFGIGNQIRETLGAQPQMPTQPPPQQQPPPPQQTPVAQQPSPTQPTTYFPPTKTKTSSTTDESETPVDERPNIGQKLIDLAYGEAERESETSASSTIPITIDGKDIATLKDTSPQASDTETPGMQPTFQPTNTFVSEDLSYAEPLGSQSTLSQTLTAMRDLLTRMLEILRPFGIRAAVEGTDSHDHME